MLKRALLKTVTAPAIVKTISAITRTQATIFMLHRFAAPEMAIEGHDPEALRRILGHLRKQKYQFLPLAELFRKMREGEPVKKAVAFTIDDGYFDHVRVGAPIFAEFDCPATIYVVTGFVDGQTWFWWDRLTYVLDRTRRQQVTARLGAEEIRYTLDTSERRNAANRDLNGRCENASEEDRLACIADLAKEAEVELPASAPPRFAPLTWEEARAAESRGITFGPHTVTHPVLSSTSEEHSTFEIEESWRRLQTELRNPVPIFCYPNGRPRDYGEREIATIRKLRFDGALVGQRGPLRPEVFRSSELARFETPRYAYWDSLPHVLQCLSGIESIKARLRGTSGK